MVDDLEDDELGQPNQPDPRTRIARPTPAGAGSMPAVTARGLGAPPLPATPAASSSATPAPGSTGELEAEGLASHLAPRPTPIPSPIEAKTTADQGELSRLESTGSGISQLSKAHPIAGGILRGLSTVGSIVAPNVTRMIPGTELHHQALIGQAQGRIGEDLGQQKEQGAIGETAAKTEQEQAAAEKDRADAAAAGQGKTTKPEPIFDKAGNIIGFNTGTDLLDLNNPAITPDMKAMADTAKVKPEAGTTPVGEASAKQYNDSILRELNVNPKTAQKVIPPEYQVNATDNDAQAKEKLQRAKDLVGGATSQQHITVDTGNKGTARSDKSYQLQSTRLDKLRTPVDQLAARFSRLTDTLNQASPQADALVAPELLSVMAGGQGSGVRMNEAEISRIVGGRSAWQNLQAAIQHWSTNPEAARSITADQDKQIRALISAVHSKVTAKQTILQKADEQLLDSDDPKEHRRIIADAEKQLNDIDAGAQGGSGGGTGGNKTQADPLGIR